MKHRDELLKELCDLYDKNDSYAFGLLAPEVDTYEMSDQIYIANGFKEHVKARIKAIMEDTGTLM